MRVDQAASYLPAGRVSPEKSKAGVEPGVNLMESQLPLGRLRYSLNSPVLCWKLVQFLSWEKFAFSTKFGDTIRSLLLVPVPRVALAGGGGGARLI